MTKTPGVRTVSSADELCRDINIYLADPLHNKAERDRTRDRMCYALDGKANERIVGHIFSALK